MPYILLRYNCAFPWEQERVKKIRLEFCNSELFISKTLFLHCFRAVPSWFETCTKNCMYVGGEYCATVSSISLQRLRNCYVQQIIDEIIQCHFSWPHCLSSAAMVSGSFFQTCCECTSASVRTSWSSLLPWNSELWVRKTSSPPRSKLEMWISILPPLI